uniref:(northern house mosquito) hypothetical protein n=1 Tax=Culex pipiens TaxID=7175 RepID=A0A8D8HFZ1_CULPI
MGNLLNISEIFASGSSICLMLLRIVMVFIHPCWMIFIEPSHGSINRSWLAVSSMSAISSAEPSDEASSFAVVDTVGLERFTFRWLCFFTRCSIRHCILPPCLPVPLASG